MISVLDAQISTFIHSKFFRVNQIVYISVGETVEVILEIEPLRRMALVRLRAEVPAGE
jgi:hypothetical protein